MGKRSKEERASLASAAGLLAGLFIDLRQAVHDDGGTDEDLYALATPEGKPTLIEMGRLIAARARKLAAAAFAAEHGFEVIKGEDVEPTLRSIDDLKIVPFLGLHESVLNGKGLRGYAKRVGAKLGLADMKFALDHESEIPPEMQDYTIVFAGTLLRNHASEAFIACLVWSGEHWLPSFERFNRGWHGRDRLASAA